MRLNSGSKNTLLDGSLTLNGDVFYYNYKNYQISEIVDRSAINQNFNTHIKGAEFEATWEPIPGLRFSFTGGWEEHRARQGVTVRGSDGSHRRKSGLDGGKAFSSPKRRTAYCQSMLLRWLHDGRWRIIV